MYMVVATQLVKTSTTSIDYYIYLHILITERNFGRVPFVLATKPSVVVKAQD